MKKLILLHYSLTALLIFTSVSALAEQEKALVNSDYVRVREKPGKDATPVGFLYKNMVVEVGAKSQDKEKLGNDAYYWYEIKGATLHGWVLGKFLTTGASNWNVDTYDAPGETQWLINRFGDSTWYNNQNMDMTSFSMDDYRNLMRAAEDGSEHAWSALRVTILDHLFKNPDDANYAYLKSRLYSEQYLLKIMEHPFASNDEHFFELLPYSRNLVMAALRKNGTIANSRGFLDSMPDDYWKDSNIAFLAINRGFGCEPANIAKIPASLTQEPKIKSALKRCNPQR